MRKRFLIMLLFSVLLILPQSCKKDEVAPLTVSKIPQAIIKGKAFAQLNVSTAGPGYEYAPTGTKIILRIPFSQLGIDTGPLANAYKTYEATISGSGDFTFTIDATLAGVTASLYCVQFEYNQDQGKDLSGQTITKRMVYYFNTLTVTVISGQTIISDIIYSTKN